MIRLLLVLLSLPASAATPYEILSRNVHWEYLARGCDMVGLRNDVTLGKLGPGWDVQVTTSLKDIDKFTTVTCPKYREQQNSPERIAEFVSENKRVNWGAIQLSTKGEQFLEALDQDTQSARRFFARVGEKPEDSPCGVYLKERAQHVRQYVQLLTAAVNRSQASCNVVTAENLKQGPKPKAPAVYGQGAPVPGKAAAVRSPASNGASDLTGTQKAIDDARKGAAETR